MTTQISKQLCFYGLLLAFSIAQAAEQPSYNRISFSEQAHQEVANDTLVAVLSVQKEGTRTDRLADEVNRIVTQALAQVQNLSEIKTRTLSYRTNPIYHKQSIKGWRVNQSIQLESQNSQLLGEKLGDLQALMQVQSISYQVSEQKQRQHTDELVVAALQRFQQQAGVIAQTMGKKSYKLVHLSINNGHTAPLHKMRHDSLVMAEAAYSRSAAPVSLDAGTQRLTVTVSGEIELTNR